MNEKLQERKLIIKMLIGNIESVGETNHDMEVMKNLPFAFDVIDDILNSILYNSLYDGYEGSCIQIKEKCRQFLKEITYMLNESSEE